MAFEWGNTAASKFGKEVELLHTLKFSNLVSRPAISLDKYGTYCVVSNYKNVKSLQMNFYSFVRPGIAYSGKLATFRLIL